ncbi:MAG: nicotinamide-nucleotide adenylyltransferase [archaeon]
MSKTALYVGRFQPFHRGHLEAIRYVLERVEVLIICVGSAQYSHTLENPFTAGERITMTRLALDEGEVDASRYYIIPIEDVNIHSLWVSQVKSLTPRFEIVFSNEPLTATLFHEAGFPVESIPFFKRDEYSSTEVRKRMIEEENWRSLVPVSVAKYVDQIQGIDRMRALSKSDKAVSKAE